ncbi:MAG: 30S ribosomal protein S20 [Alphaproteobacteria bacterium]|nr:MAG: 30S ribosomal protein S20 [Alphaproteobacteria bacterium]
MANTQSAKKAIRSMARRTIVNQSRRSRIRTYIRKVEEAIENGSKEAALNALKEAQPQLMRGVTKGIFHRNTASRKVSRLSRRINAMQS